MIDKTSKTARMPPVPGPPDHHPEKPPPNIPIPGEPTLIDERHSYKCRICGKVYNSKTEIDVHMSIEHGS